MPAEAVAVVGISQRDPAYDRVVVALLTVRMIPTGAPKKSISSASQHRLSPNLRRRERNRSGHWFARG